MELAKQALDVGFFIDGDLQPVLDHWQNVVGVPFDETLPTGGGVRQHRHRLDGSIIKINHARDPLERRPAAGYQRLLIANDDVPEATDVSDSCGQSVALIPRGEVEQLRLVVATDDVPRHVKYYEHALQLERIGECLFACGISQIEVVEGPATSMQPMRAAPGFRYVTLQVRDVVAEHAGILERARALGGREGRAPVRLGDVAHISFVLDPGGNWIEISQRKSLTGSLD